MLLKGANVGSNSETGDIKSILTPLVERQRVDQAAQLVDMTQAGIRCQASVAGVTVRAVRHYHQRGLLPEPPRDPSGYRRYGAQAVVDLIRTKALSAAGVPLARVRELLEGTPDDFTRALGEIDASLTEEIRRLEGHRRVVAQLAGVDALALPAPVVEYLARLRTHGFTERIIAMERDAWLLVSAHAPDRVAAWVTGKATMLDDETFVSVYRSFDEAFDWHPDDFRLERLADDLAALMRNFEPTTSDADIDIDNTLAAMVDARALAASPGWRHLATLLERRGSNT
jgi:DNA-binding transcriptional MerR regulator